MASRFVSATAIDTIAAAAAAAAAAVNSFLKCIDFLLLLLL